MSDVSDFEAGLKAELAKLNTLATPTPVARREKPPRGIKHTFLVFKHFPAHPYEFTHIANTISELQAGIDARKAAKKEGVTILRTLKVEHFV